MVWNILLVKQKYMETCFVVRYPVIYSWNCCKSYFWGEYSFLDKLKAGEDAQGITMKNMLIMMMIIRVFE